MKKIKLNIQRFASGESQWFEDLPLQMKMTWESTAGTSEQNYSIVTTRIYGARNSSSTKGKSWNGYLNVGGNYHSFSQIYTGQSTTVGTAWVLMAYYTDTIYHESNGTKTITISGGLGGPSGTSLSSKWCEGSFQATLDTIPRGSAFITTSWNRDEQRGLSSILSIPAVQNVEGVYHKLEARFMNNGTETTICTRTGVTIDNGAISFAFTNAELNTIYNLMPNETTHYIRMYLYTYTDSGYTNQLGDVSIIWWTGLITLDIVPTAALSYSEVGDVPQEWGVWVKGKSKVDFTLTGTGIYGSTITSYSISGDGATYNSNTATTNYLSTAGTITFTGVVTDSRNRQGSIQAILNVEDYYNPSFTITQAQRCDSQGNIDDNGEYLYYNFAGSISSCDGNNKANTTYKIGYRIQNTGDYTYITIDSNKESINASGVLNGATFDPNTTYDIQFAIQDTFTTSTSIQTLDTGFDLMNWNAAGTSMAIGKVSERTANEKILDIALETIIDENATITGNVEIGGAFSINNVSLIDLIYPVGSIYMSVNNVSPASFLGGTWVALQDTFLIGAGNDYSVNSTGGSTTHSHKYGIQAGAYWADTIFENDSNAGTLNYDTNGNFTITQATEIGVYNVDTNGNSSASKKTVSAAHIRSISQSEYVSTLPPYLAVYMWKRTN